MKVTLASLPSLLADVQGNVDRVTEVVERAADEGARLAVFPELMLTGHGAHPLMVDNGEPAPDGPLARAVCELSEKHRIAVCVGMAEIDNGVAFNSQIVFDSGRYLGCQRKIHPSGDEYQYFAPGTEVPVFDIGDMRFGISICYDAHFPEFSLIHALANVDAVLSVHAARCGAWPAQPDEAFARKKISERQSSWIKRWSGRAEDYNFYVLLCDAVGPSTHGLDGVRANHAGTVMVIDPRGTPIVTTAATSFEPEVVTVEIDTDARVRNHAPTRNRRLDVFRRALSKATQHDW